MRQTFMRFAVAFLTAAVLAGCQAVADDSYHVVNVYPHDPHAYTQGLIYLDGHLYESTGLNGRSSVRMVDLTTGRVLQSVAVPEQYFAEGLTDWGSTLVQLTWQSHIGFVYDRFSLRLLRTFNYDCEGWGLTQDGKNLIVSDGSAELRFWDPSTFREVRHINVTDHGRKVDQLNELEYIHGEIYANVWHTDRIARISPATGKVLGWINLAGLLPEDQRSDPEAVLNGIAYDAGHDRLFITGKLWPKLFEIKVVPAPGKEAPASHGK
jgi:glutaminyl-peptide cyclotransferase